VDPAVSSDVAVVANLRNHFQPNVDADGAEASLHRCIHVVLITEIEPESEKTQSVL
jgi:hypothetical protein